ncbi:MAG: undecaprenyl diphosphate synthase family protein [Candidatus Cyclonatronum sp.]|nr:undecaprenyl diphosphate synthase family protein [Cyclonatronum sp.]
MIDCNISWAKKHDLPKSEGHRKGAEIAKKIVEASPKFNIK